jgi:hypothetical protein
MGIITCLRNYLLAIYLVFALTSVSTDVWAQSDTNIFVSFPDFSNTNGLTFNGSADTTNTTDGRVLRVMPSEYWGNGSVFSSTQVNADRFSTFFTFRFTECDGAGGGADGFTFVIQSISASLGGLGGGLGYDGVTNSVGVEFDIYDNGAGYNDPNDSHVGIDVAGGFDFVPGETNATAISPNMKDGNLWFAWVDYDGSVLEARVNQTGIRPILPTVARTVNVTNEIQSETGYVGFTAATGAGKANHDIISWQYNSSFGAITNIVGIPPDVDIQTYAGLKVRGTVGAFYEVQYVDALESTNWITAADVYLTQSPQFWFDVSKPVNTKRFYRVIAKP